MDKATATAAINADAAQVVTLTDGTEIVGTVFSINSKGMNIRTDAGVVSRALSKIETVTPVPTTPDFPEDGATPADVAAMFDVAAKDVRVVLRRLGMGVGKGQRYALTPADVAAIKAEMDREAAAAAAAADADADA